MNAEFFEDIDTVIKKHAADLEAEDLRDVSDHMCHIAERWDAVEGVA